MAGDGVTERWTANLKAGLAPEGPDGGKKVHALWMGFQGFKFLNSLL